MATVTQDSMYDTTSAHFALTRIATLVEQAELPMSDRVADTRRVLAELVDNQELAVAGLREFEPTSTENAALLGKLADALAQQTATPVEVADYLAKVSATNTASLEKLVNATKFRFAKIADQALRQLGDAIVTDLLRPLIQHYAHQLAPDAAVVVESQQNRTPATAASEAAFERAEKVVADMHSIWQAANALRRHKVLRDGDIDYDRRLLCFENPHLLADIDTSHRDTWWMSFAVVNGAKPTVQTYDEALLHRPVAV
ncbi:hypothetical protein CH263_25700 [Rhodococcus sp. 06-1059B-a]|nr:hypothetical protein [Rhodococcus sp. 06-1059B-a]OZD57588.1 hypothetical protein CH263_25700 [Rhodococcus sp. 06-1059B-a]